MSSTAWVCPHLDPESWALIQRSLAFSIKYANRDPQTKAELQALHDLVADVRDKNLARRTAARNASSRFRARKTAPRQIVLLPRDANGRWQSPEPARQQGYA